MCPFVAYDIDIVLCTIPTVTFYTWSYVLNVVLLKILYYANYKPSYTTEISSGLSVTSVTTVLKLFNYLLK